MPVTVRYIDGDPVTYDAVTSASLDSGFMRLSIWNKKKRRLEDVDVLDAKRIPWPKSCRTGSLSR